MSNILSSNISLKLKVLHVLRYVIGIVARFIFALYYGNTGEKIPPIKDDILKLPAVDVAKKIRIKSILYRIHVHGSHPVNMDAITSVEVLEACIRRIKDVNSALNCFVEDRFELALKEAKDADALIASGTQTEEQLLKDKPFLGVPFTTKDCIGVKGLHQTAGVVLRKDLIVEEDAHVIKLLRDKGAIIIGLTCVPELCMWWETHNHIHGRTKNPYNTTRIVGGSSGGEGCLQAAAGSCFGIGSDIGGSIRMPAFFNGVFGHYPSRNIVSNVGQFPFPKTALLNSFLGVGPLVRHAVDLKPILEIISGENRKQLKLEEPVVIEKLKVYYQTSNNAPLIDNVDKDIKAAMDKVIEFLNVKHNIKTKEIKIERFQKSISLWLTTMKTDVPFGARIMEKYTYFGTVIEIVKNIIGCSGNTLIALFTALVDVGGIKYESEKYYEYLNKRENLEEEVKTILGDDGVLLYPTHPTPAPYHNEPVLKPFNFVYTAIVNCLGFPATHIPLGLNREGLPIGIQVIANHNNDRLCLAVAETLDKAFGGWKEP